jgi:hypothetical protein
VATVRKIQLALLGLAWTSVVAADIGVLNTPRSYCSELPTPTGQVVTLVGLAVAAGAVLTGLSIESFRDTSLRTFGGALAVGGVTIAACIGVGVLAAHQAASWGCG